MPKSKVQDAKEVERWIEEGRTYRWMAEEYGRKYNIEAKPTMFSTYRARHGLARRAARNDNLIPWAVKLEHRWAYPIALLRMESRARAGFEMRGEDLGRLKSFHADLEAGDLVVHYDPDTRQGWWLIPRQEGDTDIIHEPPRKTTQRRNADRDD